MRELLLVVALTALACFLLITLSPKADSKETTTLDDALNRPVKVEKFVDKENGVVCYYVGRVPDYLNCVYVPQPGLTWRNKRILE